MKNTWQIIHSNQVYFCNLALTQRIRYPRLSDALIFNAERGSNASWLAAPFLFMKQWRFIPGYEDHYMVSDCGMIKSVARNIQYKDGRNKSLPEKILSLKDNGNGYLFCSLWKQGIGVDFFVHRIVGAVFIPNPNNYATLNHKNLNPKDNRVENLEWCTQSYNNKHSYMNGRKSPSLGQKGLNSLRLKIVAQCIHTGQRYTQKDAAKFLGVSHATINNIVRGATKKNWTNFIFYRV